MNDDTPTTGITGRIAREWCEHGVARQHVWTPQGLCRNCGDRWPTSEEGFARDLESLINRYSRENASNTPDYILAQFLLGCLAAWNMGVQQRETWYGRDARPTSSGQNPLPEPVAASDAEQDT